MDFRERLLKTDIRHLNENLQIVSDELMLLHEFIRTEFGMKYQKFVEERQNRAAGFEDASSSSTVRSKNRKSENVTTGVVDKLGAAIKRDSRGSVVNVVEPQNQHILPGEVIPDVLADGEIVIVSTESTATTSAAGDQQFNEFDELITFEEDNDGNVSAVGNNSNEDSNSEDSHEQDDDDSDYCEDKQRKGSKKTRNTYKYRKIKKHSKSRSSQMKSSGSGSPRSCPICEETVDRSKLKDHVQSHTKEEAERKLVCTLCCISFPSAKRFRSHREKYHSKPEVGGDKGQCRFCGKQCGGNYRRIEHERSHTGERPYACLLCQDMKFTRRDNLNRHMRMVHEKIPESSKQST